MYTRFYFENPRKEEYGYIRLSLKLSQGKYYRVYIPGERIQAKHWSNKDQRALRSCPEQGSINQYLDHIEREANAIRRRLDIAGKLTSLEAQREVDNLLNKQKDSFWELWEQFLLEKKNYNTSEDRNTLDRKYRNVKNKLYKWNKNLGFEDITLDTCHRFATYLFEEYDTNVNTTSRYISRIKTFMNSMKKRGHHSIDSYNDFSLKKVAPKLPYFTTDEVQLLHTSRLERDDWNNARINILKGCYSGQRHSDWPQLIPENLVDANGQLCYSVTQKKTGKQVLVPATRKLQEVVNMGSHPISNQKMNVYLKELCEDLNINTAFIKPTNKGNIQKNIVYKKYEVVSTHIGRRTFICNSILKGKQRELIMKVSGHTSDSAFRRYVQLSSSDGMDQFEDVF